MKKNKINALKSSSEKKLIIYLTAGYPDFKTCLKIAHEAIKNGADIIELGIPFSDPIADGKTIQASSYRALKKSFANNKSHLKKIFRLASRIAEHADNNVQVYIMSYLNPLLSYGISQLEKDARRNRIAGFIVPDLACESAVKLKNYGFKLPRNLVFMASPNSVDNIPRLKEIVSESSGFIYAVSVLGVTGARKNLKPPIRFLTTLRRLCLCKGKKVYAGFGVSTTKSARYLSRFADGVIVGSAIIEIIDKSGKSKAPYNVGKFCASLKKAMTQS